MLIVVLARELAVWAATLARIVRHSHEDRFSGPAGEGIGEHNPISRVKPFTASGPIDVGDPVYMGADGRVRAKHDPANIPLSDPPCAITSTAGAYIKAYEHVGFDEKSGHILPDWILAPDTPQHLRGYITNDASNGDIVTMMPYGDASPRFMDRKDYEYLNSFYPDQAKVTAVTTAGQTIYRDDPVVVDRKTGYALRRDGAPRDALEDPLYVGRAATGAAKGELVDINVQGGEPAAKLPPNGQYARAMYKGIEDQLQPYLECNTCHERVRDLGKGGQRCQVRYRREDRLVQCGGSLVERPYDPVWGFGWPVRYSERRRINEYK